MLRRLASGAALIAAAVLLAACTPPEAVETTPAVSDEQLLARASTAFDQFYEEVDRQFARGVASASELEEHATPAFAGEFARQIQASLGRGDISRGVLEITNLELGDRRADGLSARMCTSADGIETTQADGTIRRGSGLDAWSATFQQANEQDRLLLASLEVDRDQTACER